MLTDIQSKLSHFSQKESSWDDDFAILEKIFKIAVFIMISVITPCYNAQIYIAQAIESVLSQTYPYWELLIVDDCSTDGSAEIILSYVKRDSRIKYFKTDYPSGSPALPRNIGIENAKGEYVAFLDSDDLWLPDKLGEQISFLERNRYDFVYSDYEKMSWDGVRSKRIIRASKISTYKNTLRSCDIPCLTVLLRKDIIQNIRFKDVCKEDYLFWLEILKAGYMAYNTGIVHALYREANESRSGNKFRMAREQWRILRRIENVDFFSALYCILFYSVKGFMKYIK